MNISHAPYASQNGYYPTENNASTFDIHTNSHSIATPEGWLAYFEELSIEQKNHSSLIGSLRFSFVPPDDSDKHIPLDVIYYGLKNAVQTGAIRKLATIHWRHHRLGLAVFSNIGDESPYFRLLAKDGKGIFKVVQSSADIIERSKEELISTTDNALRSYRPSHYYMQ